MYLVSILRARFIEGILEDKELALTPDICARVAFDAPPPDTPCDLATNAALVLSKACNLPPLRLAERWRSLLADDPLVSSLTIAKPGFLNLTLSNHAIAELLRSLLDPESSRPSTQRPTSSINIEFVSANPTGPLHIGHTRGAVVGDVLARLFERQGHDVRREYYVNDRGEQMATLARSLHWRYRQLFDPVLATQEIPQGLYPGAYLRECASALRARDGAKWLVAQEENPSSKRTPFFEAGDASNESPEESPEERSCDDSSSDASSCASSSPPAFWEQPLQEFAREQMMECIREDLAALGVRFDSFVSEQQLVEQGSVANLLSDLRQRDLVRLATLPAPKASRARKVERPEKHLVLATSRFGDSGDRVLQTASGKTTYFAVDLAYHLDKLKRGATRLVDVFGADHSGHALRLQAALKACHDGKDSPPALEVVSCQIVRLMEDGKPLKMSKRGGAFLDLRSLLQRVGKDAVRFLMLLRKTDAPLDFDLNTALAHSHDNPVFYAQYAHARCCSVLRLAQPNYATDPKVLAQADSTLLASPAERRLLRNLLLFEGRISSATTSLEPHRLAFAIGDLAASLHAWWNEGNKNHNFRILPAETSAHIQPVTSARLALVSAARLTLKTGLDLCGVSAPQEMT